MKKMFKRMLIPALVATGTYLIVLLLTIYITNQSSYLSFPIEAFVQGSDPPDFFFALFTSIPFSWQMFYFVKDNFLSYVSTRTNVKRYLKKHVATAMILCFLMVFAVNMIGIVFSVSIASIDEVTRPDLYSGYILGNMQMERPVLFGLIWSAYKGLLCALICLLAQIFAYYVQNFFLALLAPFMIVFLENLFTSILRIPQFSFTTAFVLNRLSEKAMKIQNLLIGIIFFCTIITVSFLVLRKYEQKSYSSES